LPTPKLPPTKSPPPSLLPLPRKPVPRQPASQISRQRPPPSRPPAAPPCLPVSAPPRARACCPLCSLQPLRRAAEQSRSKNGISHSHSTHATPPRVSETRPLTLSYRRFQAVIGTSLARWRCIGFSMEGGDSGYRGWGRNAGSVPHDCMRRTGCLWFGSVGTAPLLGSFFSLLATRSQSVSHYSAIHSN
jgi:hypothetical protein